MTARRRSLPADTWRHIQEVYDTATDMTVAEIAAAFNVSTATLYNRLDTRTKGRRYTGRRKPKPDARTSLRADETEHLRQLHAASARLRPSMPADHPAWKAATEFAKWLHRYLQQGLSVRYLAAILGEDESLIVRIVRHRNRRLAAQRPSAGRPIQPDLILDDSADRGSEIREGESADDNGGRGKDPVTEECIKQFAADPCGATQGLYNAGETIASIAATFGISETTVYKYIDPATMGSRRTSPRKRGQRTRRTLTADEIKQLQQLQGVAATLRAEMPDGHPVRRAAEEYAALLNIYVGAGLAPAYLGEVVGRSRSAVIKRLVDYGYRPRPPSMVKPG